MSEILLRQISGDFSSNYDIVVIMFQRDICCLSKSSKVDLSEFTELLCKEVFLFVSVKCRSYSRISHCHSNTFLYD